MGSRARVSPRIPRALELQASRPCGLRQRLHASVELAVAAVEDHARDALLDRQPGDLLSDRGGALRLLLARELRGDGLRGRADSADGAPGSIVDHLGVDVLRGPVHREAHDVPRAPQAAAHGELAALPAGLFPGGFLHDRSGGLAPEALADLAPDVLVGVAHALAL